jgi:hypothetical protein
MEFIVEKDNQLFEISELVKSVTWKDVLNDGCSKLEFSYINKDMDIFNGNVVRFIYGDIKYRGYVFKHGTNQKKETSITTYDQLRYCKTKDTIVVRNDTITTLTNKMCNYFSLRKGNIMDTKYILPVSAQDDKTWLDIIYTAISDTLMNKGIWYSLRDEYGGISIRDLDELKLDLILGDENLCYEYEYEKSIDDGFYNVVKLVSDNETTGKRDTYIVKDSNSISKYGLIQYFEVLDKNTNTAQAKSKADMLLSLYNKEVETLTLNCLGDSRIRAGVSFYAEIGDIGLKKRLIVKSVTHSFIPIHTMTLEVAI